MTANTDTLSRYMQEIKKYARVTPAREVELSRTIQGNSDGEAVEAAVDELVHANLLLVVHCTKGFINYTTLPGYAISEMDLISEGNIALMHAAKGFNARFSDGCAGKPKTVRFSTYACTCIKRQMLRAVREASFIHIPEYHFACRRKMVHAEADLGRDASDEAISEELGIGNEGLRCVREGRECQIEMLEDMATDENGESLWVTAIADSNTVEPDREAAGKDLLAFIVKEVQKLQPRTRIIISRLFLAERKATLMELAKQFKISAERCRQICARGLVLLRKQLLPEWGSTVGIGYSFGRRTIAAEAVDAAGQGIMVASLAEPVSFRGMGVREVA